MIYTIFGLSWRRISFKNSDYRNCETINRQRHEEKLCVAIETNVSLL